jgi:hypothetical protein
MTRFCFYIFLFLFCEIGKAQLVQIFGKVTDQETKQGISNAHVRLAGSTISTETDKAGTFHLSLSPRQLYPLQVQHLSYQFKTQQVQGKNKDTIFVEIRMQQKTNLLDSVTVTGILKPETLVGKPDYSVFDFDFFDPYFILLCSSKNLKSAQLKLSSYDGQIMCTWEIPAAAGEAKGLYRDYEGYTELVCADSVFRIDVFNNQFYMTAIRKTDYEKSIKPIADTLNKAYLWSDYWENYPQMNYFSWKKEDSVSKLLQQITNRDLLKLYNLEYYYLPSRAQLEARRMAADYKTDPHVIAALMSGFTRSMYYEPLYAPLFVMKDTICIFDHHSDFLFHYTKNNQLIDSVAINYHHPDKWKEWKRKLLVDDEEAAVYAYFSKDGHHYLKKINYQSGKITLTYHLQNHSADKLKIRGGYVYYIYRPFGSTQEKFLYRERIY